MYDPALGRFHTMDPMAEFTRGQTPYHYVCNNPIGLIDPTGMYSTEEWKKDNGVTDDDLITVYQAPSDDNEPTDDQTAIAEAKYWGGIETNDPMVAQVRKEQSYLEAWAPDLASFYEFAMQQDDLSAADIALLAAERNSQVKGLIMMKVFSPENVGMILGMAMGTGGTSSRVRNTAFKYLARHGSSMSGQGFKSFYSFKKAFGSAGKGNAWHHIVEQTPGNVQKFGAKSIHNTKNLVKLPHGAGSVHAKISGHYSSIQPFTNGQTVRQWLSTQNYNAQMRYGLKILQQFTK